MELLVLLIERRGGLVTREEIVEKLWGKNAFLDADSAVNTAVRKIRHALRDEIEQPRFLQTVSGRGYRFIAKVTEPNVAAAGGDGTTSVSPAAVVSAVQPQPEVLQRRTWYSWGLIACVVIILVGVLVGGVLWVRSRRSPKSAIAPKRVMLAVLPFENLSNDPAQEYFSDGLTEETITDLGELNPEKLGRDRPHFGDGV